MLAESIAALRPRTTAHHNPSHTFCSGRTHENTNGSALRQIPHPSPHPPHESCGSWKGEDVTFHALFDEANLKDLPFFFLSTSNAQMPADLTNRKLKTRRRREGKRDPDKRPKRRKQIKKEGLFFVSCLHQKLGGRKLRCQSNRIPGSHTRERDLNRNFG